MIVLLWYSQTLGAFYSQTPISVGYLLVLIRSSKCVIIIIIIIIIIPE